MNLEGLKNLDSKKMLLAALALLAVLYLDTTLFIKMQRQALKNAGLKITKLKADVAALSHEVAAMQKLSEGKDEAPRIKKIISEGQVSSLLAEIDQIANKNNVSIMQIKPLRDAAAKVELPPVAGQICPFPITLVLSGGYHNIGGFINGLESAEEFIVVDELKIIAEANNYFQQKANLILKTYVKKE